MYGIIFTCGGGEPVATHLNEMNWPGRTICSLNVDIISGVISVMGGKSESDFYTNEQAALRITLKVFFIAKLSVLNAHGNVCTSYVRKVQHHTIYNQRGLV